MKNIKIFVLCAAMAVLAACEKEDAVRLDAIYGEWKLESWYGQPAGEGDVPADVYLSFSDDGTFELYQKLGAAGHYTAFYGIYSVDSEGLLCGTYSDEKSWGGTYAFSVESDRLTLENSEAAGQGVCIYVRTTIPDSVIKDAEDYTITKACDDSILSGEPSEKPVL